MVRSIIEITSYRSTHREGDTLVVTKLDLSGENSGDRTW